MASEIQDRFNGILEEVKEKLDKKIVSNPKFDSLFLREIKYIFCKTKDHGLDVIVTSDQKTVSIISNSPVIDCPMEEFRGNNKAYIESRISLHENNLYLEYFQGVLFDRRKLEKNGIRALASYETKLETNYYLKCIDKDGIEYSNSSFQDSYPLSQESKEINIKEQVFSSFHKPEFYEYKLPKAPIHVLKAIVRNTYRKEDSLAVIHTNMATITKEGYQDINCALFTTHPLFPDMLRGDKVIAKSVNYNNRIIFVAEKDYAESVEEGYKKAEKDLKNALKGKKNIAEKIVYKRLK